MPGKVNFSLVIMRSHIKEVVLSFEIDRCAAMPEIKAEDKVIILYVFVIPKKENRTNETFASAFLKTLLEKICYFLS